VRTGRGRPAHVPNRAPRAASAALVPGEDASAAPLEKRAARRDQGGLRARFEALRAAQRAAVPAPAMPTRAPVDVAPPEPLPVRQVAVDIEPRGAKVRAAFERGP
jgi:hypothetical protein